MAYDDYEDEKESAEDMFLAITQQMSALDGRLKKIADNVEDSGASIRMEMAQNRREMAEIRAAMGRLQNRLDNQLMTLVFSNVASSLGAVALIVGLTHTV